MSILVRFGDVKIKRFVLIYGETDISIGFATIFVPVYQGKPHLLA